MNEVERVAAMRRRIGRAARRAAIRPAPLEGAFDHAMRIRTPRFDARHPDFLHPGRTALVLIEDVRAADEALIVAATLHDSDRPDLSAGEQIAHDTGGSRARQLSAALETLRHVPADERLEALVLLERDARLAALAERLDHARHLHLKPPARWAAFHTSIRDADLPAASRTHPVLERRFRWWTDMFARRFLRP